MLRWTRAIWLIGALFIACSCQPNRKSIDVANPCSQPIVVRLWDLSDPPPGDNSYKDVTVQPLEIRTVLDVITAVSGGTVRVEVLAPSRGPVALQIERSGPRNAVIPATACTA
jgi:hypothetical protein